MKKTVILYISGIIALTSFFSCGVDRWTEYQSEIGLDLWIDSVMRQEYLWQEDMPSSKDLNYFLEPESFFKKLLSSRDKNYSSVDTLDNELALSYGFNYTLYKLANNDTVYNALITYVVPDSPANVAGLKRGDWLMMMDNDYITKRNEESLTTGSSKQFVIGKFTLTQDEEGEEIGVVQPIGEVNVDAARATTDVPIHMASVSQIGDKTVGYLAYSFFATGPTNNSQEYNNQLRSLFTQFKEAGVNEFVLDLRYNSGGEMECAQLLSTMLAPADRMNSPWAILKYNSRQVGKNKELALNPELIQTGVNLNLSTLYVLTTKETAAASEMVINCLKPYMNVVLIGETTQGENVATGTFINRHFNWSIHPVVCEVYNSKEESNYANGFTPNYQVNEFADLRYFLPFGNPQEALLNKALSLIAGNAPATKADIQSKTGQMTALKSVNICRKPHRGLTIR